MNDLNTLRLMQKLEQEIFDNVKTYEWLESKYKDSHSIDGDLVEYLQGDEGLFSAFLNEYFKTLGIKIQCMEFDTKVEYRGTRFFLANIDSEYLFKPLAEAYKKSLDDYEALITRLFNVRFHGADCAFDIVR